MGRTFRLWLDHLGGKSINGIKTMFPDENSVPYHVYFFNLNAKDHNIPQNRERVFVVGIRDDVDNVFKVPKKEKLKIFLKDCLEKNPHQKYFVSEKYESYLRNKKIENEKKGYGFGFTNGLNSKIVSTITTKFGWRGSDMFLDYGLGKIRRFTPAECFRFMDFNENFKWNVSDIQAYKQAGNSIPVGMLVKIISKLNL